MKTERVNYLISAFEDYAGEQHRFVIAAVSRVLPKTEVVRTDNDDEYDEDVSYLVMKTNEYDEYELDEVVKCLYVGVAVCNPKDTFDEALGQKIAYQKALKSDAKLYTTKLGLINNTVVNALLEQEEEFIKNNPGSVIKNYNNLRAEYERLADLEESVLNAPKSVLKELKKDTSWCTEVLESIKNLLSFEKGRNLLNDILGAIRD